MEELFTTRELADFLRLNEKRVYQLIREGGIPHVRIAGKWLFPKDHVERWIDENVQQERDILVVGSDDILLARLLSLYSREQFPRSLTFYSSVGSLRGIEAVANRKGQVCCVHLLDVETGEYNLPFLRRYLAPQKYVVVNLCYRRQGLIINKGNPLGLKDLRDAVRKGARFITRNQGSGTRLLFEYLLNERGLAVEEVVGFSNEVDTHMEVGLKVLFGEADAGLGIEYVAHLLPLDFIPLREERFDLVLPKELWPTQLMKRFLSHVDPAPLRRLVPSLPGYTLKDTGRVIFES